MQSKTSTISKISCGHCVNTIQSELGELPGVLNVEASSETKSVVVQWDETVQTWENIENCLGKIGFAPD